MKNQKKLNEAVDTSYSLEDLQRLLSLDTELKYGLGIIAQPKSEGTPFAWDNSIELDGNTVTISGHLAPGGPESGSVIIKTSFDNFKKYYELRADLSALDEYSSEDLSEEEKDFVKRLCNPY